MIQLLLSKITNKTLDKYLTNTEVSNYLVYLLLHPARTLNAVQFYAQAIKKRFPSSADPPKYYPQYINTVYKQIKSSKFSPEIRFIKSCFKNSSETISAGGY